MGDEPVAAKVDNPSYTKDVDGNRVLIGLTMQETQELEELRRIWWKDHTSKDGTRSYGSIEERDVARARRMELTAKHDRARIEFVAAEIALRHKPTIN